ncbi:hypothetical protein [Cohnella nanjingensis]|nr:hypothetical protein [Cohnella nanjingensis]
MELGRQILISANVWLGISLFLFVAFRFARLRGGRGFGRRRHER